MSLIVLRSHDRRPVGLLLNDLDPIRQSPFGSESYISTLLEGGGGKGSTYVAKPGTNNCLATRVRRYVPLSVQAKCLGAMLEPWSTTNRLTAGNL